MRALIPDADVVHDGLISGCQIPVDIHVFDKLDSTSAWLGARRESLASQLVQGRAQICVTDWQQAGVGRRGKSWQTLPGNVTFSVLARYNEPAQNLLGLSLVTGIAVAETLEEMFSLNAMLKWPNDIILDDHKLGGLLTEVITVPSRAGVMPAMGCDVVTGIGINVVHDESVVGLGIGATSLMGAGVEMLSVDRDSLIGRIGAAVLCSHQIFLQKGWATFAARWDMRDWLRDKDVVIHHMEAQELSVARGVNQQGALLVEGAGKLVPLYGGDVSIRPVVTRSGV